MLFGASLHCGNNEGAVSVRIFRCQNNWALLSWAMVQIELSEPSLFHFTPVLTRRGDSMVICIRSAARRAFRPAYEKWYSTGQRKLPDEFKLNDEFIAWWLASSWSSGNLNFPGLTKSRIQNLVKGTPLQTWGKNCDTFIAVQNKDAASRWLSDRIPRPIWDLNYVED